MHKSVWILCGLGIEIVINVGANLDILGVINGNQCIVAKPLVFTIDGRNVMSLFELISGDDYVADAINLNR